MPLLHPQPAPLPFSTPAGVAVAVGATAGAGSSVLGAMMVNVAAASTWLVGNAMAASMAGSAGAALGAMMLGLWTRLQFFALTADVSAPLSDIYRYCLAGPRSLIILSENPVPL